MGTNYYIKKNICKTCGRCEEEIHLGKCSWGWQFSFQYNGGQYYKNVEEMKKWTKGKQIWDEYDKKITYKDFWKMVADKQKKINKNHAASFQSATEHVIDGYSFSDTEFC